MRTGLIDTLHPAPRGVVFDYGNTLIPFGQREVDAISADLAAFIGGELPGATPEAVRPALAATLVGLHREREATNRESDPRDVFRRTFAALGREVSEDGQAARGVAALHDAFVRACALAPDTVTVLEDLRRRGLALGLLSNYSLASAIRSSLVRLGIDGFFDAVLVSADLGVVKPEPVLFARIAADLGLPPHDILLVGDNLKADVAGGAAAGMRTAQVTEHLGGAYYFVHPDETHADVAPDLVLPRLIDLVDRR